MKSWGRLIWNQRLRLCTVVTDTSLSLFHHRGPTPPFSHIRANAPLKRVCSVEVSCSRRRLCYENFTYAATTLFSVFLPSPKSWVKCYHVGIAGTSLRHRRTPPSAASSSTELSWASPSSLMDVLASLWVLEAVRAFNSYAIALWSLEHLLTGPGAATVRVTLTGVRPEPNFKLSSVWDHLRHVYLCIWGRVMHSGPLPELTGSPVSSGKIKDSSSRIWKGVGALCKTPRLSWIALRTHV